MAYLDQFQELIKEAGLEGIVIINDGGINDLEISLPSIELEYKALDGAIVKRDAYLLEGGPSTETLTLKIKEFIKHYKNENNNIVVALEKYYEGSYLDVASIKERGNKSPISSSQVELKEVIAEEGIKRKTSKLKTKTN